MALSLNYASPFGGDDFTYFIIGEVHENRYFHTATVTLYGFLDHTARQAMSAYVPINVILDSNQWIKDATIAEIYELVKETPAFADATDA